MFEIIEPCKKCGAPPRRRMAVTTDDCHYSDQFCPVCDISSALPFRWHRRAVWLRDHRPVVSVRFRHGWFGGQRYHRLREKIKRRKPYPPPWQSGRSSQELGYGPLEPITSNEAP